MKLNVEEPDILIDINRLSLDKIETTKDGVKIGALVRNSDLAQHPFVKTNYQVLSRSAAVRRLGAVAQHGNDRRQSAPAHTLRVLPRYRICLQQARARQRIALQVDGDNRTMAVLGTSEHCIATNPSDMNVALMALEATIHIQGPSGTRQVAINDFYLLPGSTPHIETVLKPGDLITHVTINSLPAGSNSTYLKYADRASYEFALASAAIIANVEGGKFSHIRIALGGVGTKPWRATEAEKVLHGASATEENFRKAAEEALHGAKSQTHNKFKIELSKRCIVHALKGATAKS